MPRATMAHASKEVEKPATVTPVEEEVFTLQPQPEVEDDDEVETDQSTPTIQVEDMPPETPIWENGPTAGDIVQWKEMHGEVYCTSVTYDKHVVWRTLERHEYKQIVRHVEQLIATGKMSQTDANMFNEELVCEVCTLFPDYKVSDFETEMAGLPSILSQQILESSGFNSVDVVQL